jgi:hypothetical protein
MKKKIKIVFIAAALFLDNSDDADPRNPDLKAE